MRRLALLLVLGLGLALAFADLSRGHGGQYRGPSDTVPPSLGTPGDIGGAPPGAPGGPITGVNAGPTTGGPLARGPVRPGAGRIASGPVTGRGGGARGEGFEKWQFWWEFNREKFINLKSKVHGSSSVRSGSTGFFLGRGSQTRQAISTSAPSQQQIQEQVLPALLAAIENETAPDILDSSLIAIARIGNDPGLLDSMTPFLNSKAQTVREAAVLGMGILGRREAIPNLSHLLLDDVDGRRLTGTPEGVPKRTRAFAAIAMGLIQDDEARNKVAPILRQAYTKGSQEALLDIPITTIIAMGLVKSPELAPDLEQILDQGKHPYIRAYAANSLGWIGATEVKDKITKLLRPQNTETDVHLRRSCAVALGLLATPEDTDAIRALQEWVTSGKELNTRNFAAMALAHIGGEEQRDFLLKQFVRGGQKTFKPWGALSLAVWAFYEKKAEVGVADAIRKELLKERNPEYRGAYCVALGLLNDQSSVDTLVHIAQDESDPELRGYAALSLGIMNATSAKDVITDIIRKHQREEKFLRQAATGLGLMGDKEAVGILIDSLQKAKTNFTQGSLALALGLIGDNSAVQPLLDLLQDDSAPDLSRGFAAVSLGMVCDKDEYPWTDRITSSMNYRMQVESVRELFDIL